MAEGVLSRKRLGALALMAFFTLADIGGTAAKCGFDLDGWLSLLFIGLVFFPVFAFVLEYDRLHGLLADNTQTSFRRVAIGYGSCSGLFLIFLFLPGWYRPLILFAVLMSALSNSRVALTSSLFWSCMLSLTCRGEALELAMNLLLVLLACMLCVTLKEEKYRFYVAVLFFAVNIMVPGVFYYLAHARMDGAYLSYLAIVGLISGTFVYAAYNTMYEETRYEVPRSYARLVAPEHPRVRELLSYSPVEYDHARNVSDIAARCGERIGIDSGLCRAAGFYYRMGRWVGEPYVENGVKRAGQLCFPLPLQEILAEFGGEKRDISTKESALVHMVDAVVLRSEVMQAQVGGSSWNKKMLVNQILNGYSAEGLYDRSGMSINEFLRVRELISEILESEPLQKTESREDYGWEDE